ncbi:MAG TPA: 50S ribosomal protein L9 [Clostridiales bacterium]|nr:MAG: 50S ribosomal protein L9 [Clostridiales bacterium GWD2_32_59]HAN09297.1 50S ribosomal protein L9 [Clostridiales bacterium]
MKLILKKDVIKLGKVGDIIEASDGYARNYLLPKGLASEATKANLCELDQKKNAEKKREKQELDEAKNKGEILKSKVFKILVKTGENGRVFGSVTTKEIAEVIKEQTGIDIDKRKIDLVDNIKNIGIYNVSVKLHHDVIASVKVEVNGK